MSLSRRHFLGASAAGTAGVVGSALTPGLAKAASMSAAPGATLDDIEHVVILMQENRSFDEYFGRMSGVIGFDDPHAVAGVFKQPGGFSQADATANGITSGNPTGAIGGITSNPTATNTDGYTIPWHMDTLTTDAQSTGGCDHGWGAQHTAWANGQMNGFLLAQEEQQITVGYYDQPDIPYHWALADNFTVLDRYHCSVFGPTNPNRIMLMSGTIDPEGTMGGPCCGNSESNSTLAWESMGETLQKAGIDWYLYQENDNYADNMLTLFTAFQDTTTDMYRRGNSFIPSTSLLGEATAAKIKADVLAGKLPQVSYIVGAAETSEHPDGTTGRGAQFIDQVLDALTADPAVWAKTLLILNYDENDGHFDHVLPPTAPAGTKGEYVTQQVALAHSADTEGMAGPVGLGFRVPCILISPFTVGPLVCSDVFDHTSVIKFLERRFGIHCPNISDWRRATVGDLTSAINFAATPSTRVPTLPSGDQQAANAKAQSTLPEPTPPSPQVMPTQRTTPARGRPSGPVAAVATNPTTSPTGAAATPGPAATTTAAKVVAKPTVTHTRRPNGTEASRGVVRSASGTSATVASEPTRTLAFTGLDGGTTAAGVLLAAAGIAAVRARRMSDASEDDPVAEDCQ